MFDHVVEFVWFLGMALFHRCDNVHHPAARLGSSQVSSSPKKDELRDVTVVESHATTVRSSVFPHF